MHAYYVAFSKLSVLLGSYWSFLPDADQHQNENQDPDPNQNDKDVKIDYKSSQKLLFHETEYFSCKKPNFDINLFFCTNVAWE